MHFNVRTVTKSEWFNESIYRRLREFYYKFYNEYEKSFAEGIIRNLLNRDDRFIVIAEVKEYEPLVVGMCICNTMLSLGRRSLMIDEVFVDEKYRGNYIGVGIINFCVNFAKEKDYDSVELVVNEDNTKAIGLYKDCLFVEKPKKYMVNILKEWKKK